MRRAAKTASVSYTRAYTTRDQPRAIVDVLYILVHAARQLHWEEPECRTYEIRQSTLNVFCFNVKRPHQIF